MFIDIWRSVGKNVIDEGEKGSLADRQLRGFEESKPIRVSKGSWKAVERKCQGRRGGRASIAGQALFP